MPKPGATLQEDLGSQGLTWLSIEGFAGGLDTRKEQLHNEPFSSPRIRNYTLRGTELRKSPGLSDFGDEPWSDQINHITKFVDTDDVEHIIAISPTELREYIGATDTWDSLTLTPAFSGAIGDFWTDAVSISATAPPGQSANRLYHVVVNGVDGPYVWDGDSAGYQEVTVSNAPIARFVATFVGRLVFFNTSTGVLDIAWSRLGDFAAADAYTGRGAGVGTVSGIEGRGTGLLPQGDTLVFYATGGIVRAERTNIGAVPFRIVSDPGPGPGLLCPRTLKALPDSRHIFLGTDLNVYTHLNGALDTVGDEIQRELQDVFKRNRTNEAFAVINKTRSEYRLYINDTKESFPQICYIYNWQDKTWYSREYVKIGENGSEVGVQVTAGTSAALSGTTTIDALTGTIDQLTGTIDELGGEGRPERIVVAATISPATASVTRIEEEGSFIEARNPALVSTDWRSATASFGDSTWWVAGDKAHTSTPGPAPLDHATNDTGVKPAADAEAKAVSIRDFGFTTADIPASVTALDGIQVEVEGSIADVDAADRAARCALDDSAIASPAARWSGSTVGASKDLGVASGSAQDVLVQWGDESDLWGLGAINPQTKIVGNTSFGVMVWRNAAPVSGGAVLRVDNAKVRCFYTDINITPIPVNSEIDIPDTHLGYPHSSKSVLALEIDYRDLSTTQDEIVVQGGSGGGDNFTQTGSVVKTAGLSDGAIKTLRSSIKLAGRTVRFRLQHNSLADFAITGFRVGFLVLGRSHG